MGILAFIDSHTGLIAWGLTAIVVLILYLRHETAGLFPFLRETLSERGNDGQLTSSTKRMSLLASVAMLLWGYAKLTLAVCRWVDRGGDPTGLYMATLAMVGGLSGTTYLIGKWIAGKVGASSDPNSSLTPKE